MKMTMFYVRAMHKKTDFHNNVPAENARGAYDFVIANILAQPDAVIVEIRALFEFEYEEPKQIVQAN